MNPHNPEEFAKAWHQLPDDDLRKQVAELEQERNGERNGDEKAKG